MKALQWSAVVCALLMGLGAGVWAYGQQQRQMERVAMLAALPVTPDTVIVAHTDTLVRRLTTTRTRIDTLVQRVPDTVRVAFPVVDTLIVESAKAGALVDSLARAVTQERASRDSALTRAHLATVAAIRAQDAPRTSQRWRDRALGGVLGFAVGVAVTR